MSNELQDAVRTAERYEHVARLKLEHIAGDLVEAEERTTRLRGQLADAVKDLREQQATLRKASEALIKG